MVLVYWWLMVDKEHQMIKQVDINLVFFLFLKTQQKWKGVNNDNQDWLSLIDIEHPLFMNIVNKIMNTNMRIIQ